MATGIKIAGAVFCLFIVGAAALRPRLYATASPRVQNGIVFVTQHSGRFQAASPAPIAMTQAFVQWLNRFFSQTNAYVTDADYPCIEVALPQGTTPAAFSATGRASNGDTFSLYSDDWMAAGNSAQNNAPHTFVRLPGVPTTVAWIDVTIDDKKGHTGMWRITEIPRLKHALSQAAPLHEVETVQKVPLQARAWWDSKGTPTTLQGEMFQQALPVVAEIRSVVPQASLALPSHSWVVSIDGLTQEWEPSDRPLPFVRGKNSLSGYSTGSSGYSVFNKNVHVTNASVQAATAPYPAVQHRAQIDATLTLRDSHDESVTFHDVPLEHSGNGLRVRVPSGGIALTTPSGVQVRLVRGAASPFSDPPGYNAVDIVAKVSPEDGMVPGSPLQKRVGKRPLHISCTIPFTSDTLASMQFSGEGTRLTYKNRLPRPVLPTLTINVSQTAELKNIPLQFTVPVQAGKPKKSWQE